MSRIVDTTLFPELTTQIPTQQNNRPCRIFGPRSIDGISGIRSYSAIAHKALERSGWAVCGPIRSHRLLKKAIYDCGNKADPEGLARAIRPELSEILRTGIDPEVLKKSASDRVKLLGNIASAYKRSLEKLKLVDREATLISALRLSTFERESTIFWGSFLARPIESRREEIDFIDAVAGDGSVYYLPLADSPLFKVNKDAVEYLKERGWIINNANSSQPETVGEKAALRFAGLTQDPVTAEGYYFESAEEEIRWVLGHIKYLIHKGESASKIAVAVREPLSYQTLIRSIADEYGLPIDIEFHQRIGLSLIGHAIWLIGEVFSEAECDFESTLRLLNYPGTKFWSKEKIARVLRSHPENKSEWFEIYEIPPIEVPDGKHTAEEWSIWLIGVLEALGLNESFSASASEAMNYLLIEELLNEISQLSGRSEVSLQGFFAELNNALETLSFQTMETRGGIVICEPHALIGRKFDHAFFIGAAEGHLPKVTSNSWILDFYEREELIKNGVNISPITEFARWEHFNFFFALSAVNKSIFLTYPSYLNGELLPSEYFDLLGIVPSRPHKNFISSQSELLINELPNKGQSKAVDLNPALFQKSKQAYKAESERLVANTDPVYNGLVKSLQIEKDKSWSVSELIDLGQCPFRWLARWAMRLERFEVAADEPAYADIGKFYHSILQKLVEKYLADNTKDIREFCTEKLEEEFEAAEQSDEFKPLVTSAFWEMERAEHIKLLKDAILSPQFITEGHVPYKVEVPFYAQWSGFNLKGRIDRIDVLADDQAAIAIDYKTSGYRRKIKNSKNQLKVELQLVIYRDAGLPKLCPKAQSKTAQAINLKDRKISMISVKDTEDLAWAVENLKKIINSRQFPVFPDSKKEACKFCDYYSLCRIRSFMPDGEDDG